MYPETLTFYEAFSSLDKAGDLLQLSVIQEDIQALEAEVTLLQTFLNSPDSQHGTFRPLMQKFLPTATQLLQKLQGLFKKGEAIFKELIVLFGERDTCTLNEFYGNINRFAIVFEKTKLDITHKRAAEAKRQEAAQNRAKVKPKYLQPKSPNKLDEVLASLQSGQAYT